MTTLSFSECSFLSLKKPFIFLQPKSSSVLNLLQAGCDNKGVQAEGMMGSSSVIVLIMDREPLLQCTQEHYALDLWKKPTATSQCLICTLILADRRSDSQREMAPKINLANFLMGHKCVKILQVNRTLLLWFLSLSDYSKTLFQM